MTKRKHGIRPPRKPRGENPKVTIGNQDKQIKLLIDRCCKLEGMLNASNNRVDEVKGQHEVISGMFEDQRQQYAELSDAFSRLSGWQDCAREMLGLALNSIAPGS